MSSSRVNSEDRRVCFIGVKLTEGELRRVKRSIKNYRIKKDTFSDSFRALLLRSYSCSVKFDKRCMDAEVLRKREINKNSDVFI